MSAGPMEVSVGEEGPGYMPWSGSWVAWCYPYPRPVQVIDSAMAVTHVF